MTKLQLLHRALNERLMAAVEQIMEMVGGTVLEYEEETIRARKENEVLRRRLRWMQGANPADWPGPSEPITLSTPDESNPSQQDECAVNFGFRQESEGLVIKTETTDHPLYSATTLPQRIDQGSDVAGTSTGITYGLADGMTWDSAQSYMAPLDFDPTSGSTRIRHWRGQNRRQRMSFACPDCGKVFGREQRLMIHMRIHSTERPYKYRRRKAFFYGDNKKKRKLHGLSQLSREIVDDLSDCSEQTSRSSASPDRLAPDQEEEPGGLSTESDHTSSDKEPENRTTTPVRDRRKKKTGSNQMQCHCPHCPDRVFARPCQLAMHMKTHTVKALVNLPNQAQSGTDEIMDVKMKSPPKDELNTFVQLQPIYEENKKATTEADAVYTVTFVSNRCFSKVWDYFSKDAYGEVICHQCSARISQGSSKASQKNTSNLWSHLRIKHQHAYLEAKGYRPVNMLINTTQIKLEPFEPEERIAEGESGIMKVLIPDEPSNGNL